MKSVEVFLVDAFTAEPGQGNRAGVVPGAWSLSTKEMQSIAAQIGAPETAFFMKATSPGADIRLRWFSPSNEVSLCGHATVAGFFQLTGLGMLPFGKPLMVETKSGILTVRVEKDGDVVVPWFTLPTPKFRRAAGILRELEGPLGTQKMPLDAELGPVRDDYLMYVPLKRFADLSKISPEMDKLAEALERRKLGGVSVFTRAKSKDGDFRSRMFAPNIGIPEDPVTGSANGPIGAYITLARLKKGRGKGGGTFKYMGAQGDLLGTPGRVRVRVKVEKGALTEVTVGGRAVLSSRRVIDLP